MITQKSPAQGRYTIRVLVLMTAYVGLLFLANWLFMTGHATGALAWFVALLPALPIIGVVIAIGRLIVELTDEYVRMLMVRQTLIATAVMLGVATAWGFLEDFDLLPHVPAYYAAILWFGGLGVGACANAILERRGEGE
jgi:hypothetical protein